MALVSVVLSRAFNTPLVPFVHLDTGGGKRKEGKSVRVARLKTIQTRFYKCAVTSLSLSHEKVARMNRVARREGRGEASEHEAKRTIAFRVIFVF